MNVHEVAGVLAHFGAAWPKMELPDDTADVWVMELGDLNADYAREAASNIIRRSNFFPSIAEFREECRQVGLRHRAKSTTPAIGEGPGEPMPLEVIASLRDQLASWSAAKPRRIASADRPASEPVMLPKSRCPRCGQDTIPYTWTLEPKDVDPPLPYSEERA